MRVGILTISDLGAAGERADTSGDAIVAWAKERGYEVALRGVAEVRGVGMMFGVEMAEGDVLALGQACRERGVIVRAAPPNIMMSPPLVVEREQVDRIVSVLEEVLSKAA